MCAHGKKISLFNHFIPNITFLQSPKISELFRGYEDVSYGLNYLSFSHPYKLKHAEGTSHSVLQKSYSEIFDKIQRKTPLAEPLFIKVAGQPTTSLNNRLHQRLSPVSFRTFFKDSFLHNLNG